MSNKQLYAIYKNGKFMGNEREISASDAINRYVVASLFEEFLDEEKFMSRYSAKLAIKGVHYDEMVYIKKKQMVTNGRYK